MGNSSGSYRSTPERSMAAFDRLPPTARKALREAAFNWATQPILTQFRRGVRGYVTGEQIAESISKWDRDQKIKEARRVWGADYAPMVLGVDSPVRRRGSIVTEVEAV